MTSGEFTSFPVDDIWVDRTNRQRTELAGIDELAHSISELGLIHPIVISRDGQLHVGERRWTAVKQLGWTNISVQFVEDMNEHELQLLELEENLRRINLTWQDECLAIYKYHMVRVSDDPSWTQAKTADMLGTDQAGVGSKIMVAKELLAGNQRVAEAPKFSVARNVTQRVNERKAQASVTLAITAGKANAPRTVAEVMATEPERKPVPLLNVDFKEWAAAYTEQPFNFIHCDFPYGVNADKHDQGQAASQGGYEDSFDVYENLCGALADAMGNVVAESAHLMFWFSMDYYEWTKSRLENMGWTVNPFPLVWFKSDNTGILPDPQRGPRRVYETAFFASRGDRKLTGNGAVANTVAWPGKDKEIHMSEKPVGMLKHFMRMIVDEYSFVLDPTAGSANSIKAAQALGAGRVLGLELNTEFFNRATEAYYAE